MNQHNQNHYGLARAAERLLTRVLLIGLFGLACFTTGYFTGEQRGFKEGKAMRQECPTAKPLAFKEMSRKQLARWQQFHKDQAKGWILK